MVLLLALSATLAACGMPDFYFMNGKIIMIGNQLTLHVSGTPDASISSAGDFNLGGKAVPVTAPQRGLLMLYYQHMEDIRERSTAMSKAEDAADGKADSGQKQQLEHQHSTCQDEANLKAVQDQLVTQMPAFKPYGNIFASADECAKH
jgi:hypothetical protein